MNSVLECTKWIPLFVVWSTYQHKRFVCVRTVSVTSYLRFFAELPSRLSAECSAAEYGLPSADRGPFEASRGLPLGRSYYSVQAVERIRYSLDAHLSTQRVKHPQQSLNRYLRPSSCGTALLLVSIRTNSSPNTAQLKDEGVCNYTIRLSTSETNYSNLKAANSNKFVCISITHPR